MERIQNFGDLTDDEDFLELYDIVEHPREPQVFRVREDHFTKWNDTEFRQRFRLSKEVVRFVTEEISEMISSQTDRKHFFWTSAKSTLDAAHDTIFRLSGFCPLEVFPEDLKDWNISW
ncbi:hypothetical protein FQR65_LT06273 [Abscondita terminalis]|nr:hypothetical protein FQR65_LT06273 [Abscondita terminalis]